MGLVREIPHIGPSSSEFPNGFPITASLGFEGVHQGDLPQVGLGPGGRCASATPASGLSPWLPLIGSTRPAPGTSPSPRASNRSRLFIIPVLSIGVSLLLWVCPLVGSTLVDGDVSLGHGRSLIGGFQLLTIGEPLLTSRVKLGPKELLSLEGLLKKRWIHH